jgi:hypothetical protein
MRHSGFAGTGGDLERWLYRAAIGGWLAPTVLHGMAARLLGRPVEQLWPAAVSASGRSLGFQRRADRTLMA